MKMTVTYPITMSVEDIEKENKKIYKVCKTGIYISYVISLLLAIVWALLKIKGICKESLFFFRFSAVVFFITLAVEKMINDWYKDSIINILKTHIKNLEGGKKNG